MRTFLKCDPNLLYASKGNSVILQTFEVKLECSPFCHKTKLREKWKLNGYVNQRFIVCIFDIY